MEQRAAARRELGVAALEMYRDGRLPAGELSEKSTPVQELDIEINQLLEELGEPPESADVDTGTTDEPQTSGDTGSIEFAQQTDESNVSEPVETGNFERQSGTEEFDAAGVGFSTESHEFESMESTLQETGDSPDTDTGDAVQPGSAPEPSGTTPSPPGGRLDDLMAELEQAEKDLQSRVSRSDESGSAQGGGGDSESSDPIRALEQQIAGDRARAEEALSELRERVATAESRAETMSKRAEAAERQAELGDPRVKTAAAEWLRRASADSVATTSAKEVDKLQKDLEKAKAEKIEAVESAERRLAEIEEKALETAKRLKESEERASAQHAQAIEEAEQRVEQAEAAARTAAAEWVRSNAGQTNRTEES